jgi:alcohol dehydrogenase class IV
MLDRHFNTPDRKSFRALTRLYAGVGARLDLKNITPEGRFLVIADARFMACDALSGIDIVLAVPITGEPTEAHVASVIEQVGRKKFSAVLAIGGGSTIDTAKAVHAHICFAKDAAHDVERPANAPVLIALPTNAGSGSETSRYYILADDRRIKRSHRAWSFAPDIAILDPELIQDAGPERLALGAFDAFVHLWETLICRGERSPFVDTLALDGITLIADALGPLASRAIPSVEQLMGVQRASAYGGMAISNVRTGIMHTLGESLAAQVNLGHPETLFVFFDVVIEHYLRHLKPEISRIDRRLAADIGPDWTFERLCHVWRLLFNRFGITERIGTALNVAAIDMESFLAAIARDTVIAKEHPAPINEAGIAALAKQGLNRSTLRPASAAVGAYL